jgi:hypothetical protein
VKPHDGTEKKSYLSIGLRVTTALLLLTATWMGTRTLATTQRNVWELVTSSNPAFDFCAGSKQRMTVVCVDLDELSPVVEGYCVTSVQRPTECYVLGE